MSDPVYLVDAGGKFIGAFVDFEPDNLPAGTPVPNPPVSADQIWLNGAWAEAPATVCDRIDALRDQRLAAGFVDAVTGKTWQCDVYSQGKWTAIGASSGLAVAMQVNPPPNYELIAADNSIATLVAADAFALINGRIMPWVSATVLYARTMKNNVLAGNPPADITAGWP